MVILVVFNSFSVVQNLKKPDPVARQMPPLYTTNASKCFSVNTAKFLRATILKKYCEWLLLRSM